MGHVLVWQESAQSQNTTVAQSPLPMALGPCGGVSASDGVCASVRLGGSEGPIPVGGHLQAEGHLEVCQLLPTFQDLGNLALQALPLLLQSVHGQLQNEGGQAMRGWLPLTALPLLPGSLLREQSPALTPLLPAQSSPSGALR